MPAPRVFKTEAIILRQRRLGEADRILTVYSPAYGKFDAKAKGVRKIASRMGGHLQPLSRCLMQLAQGHVNEVITGSQTLESFQPLREDLDRLSRALYSVELLDRLTPERVPGLPTYRLLLDTFRSLEHSLNLDLPIRYFEIRLMDQAGFRPELRQCVVCSRPLEPQQNFFSPIAGGALCPPCVPGLAGPRVLSLNALKVLRLLQRGAYNEIHRLKMQPDLADEVERHLRSYIVCVLERDVKAASFIERLRREGLREFAQT